MNAAMLMLVASTMTAPQPAATSEVVASPSYEVNTAVFTPSFAANEVVATSFAKNSLLSEPSFTMGGNATFVPKRSEHPEFFQQTVTSGGKGSPTHQMGGKTITIFIQAGFLFCCDHAGFMIGGGIALVPMSDHKQFEFNADVHYMRIASTNGWNLSFNGQYNFILAAHKFNPFAGGGLAIASFNFNTNVALQLFGGIQTNLASGRAIRFQIRFAFFDQATSTIILFGFAF